MNITGGKYKGRVVKAPDEKIVRPTLSKVRMSVFNVLFSILGDFEDKIFLDMFGGSGIMGLEALSRGFKKVVIYEKNNKVAEVIKSNYNALGIKPDLFIGDAIKLFSKSDEKFDVIYVDPPYMSGVYEDVLDVLKKKSGRTIVILEHVGELDFEGFKLLKQKKYGDKYLSYLHTAD